MSSRPENRQARTVYKIGGSPNVDANLFKANLTPDARWLLENSFVVPEVSQIQKGDLLVGTEGSDLSLGIVVNDPGVISTDGLDQAMAKVEVVAVSQATQRAVYVQWKNLSLTPQGYHVRRLVSQAGANDAAPLVVRDGFLQILNPLTYELADRPDPDNFGPWLPNTGELKDLGKIKLTAIAGNPSAQLAQGSTWTISRAWDYYGDQSMGGNITVNTTKTVFHLMAFQGNRPENGINKVSTTNNGKPLDESGLIDVAVFTNNLDGTYQVKLHPGLLTAVQTDGTLAVLSNAETYDHFGMIAENAVPGDDLGLQFQVDTGTGQWNTDVTGAQRLAVYDKKLLWRANLYVDEGGPTDWNNLHPWITDNKWNPIGGDGKQDILKIASWSSFWEKGKNAYNSVAYSIGSMDDPMTFNTNMDSQKLAMQNLASDTTTMARDFNSLRPKNSSVAPQDDWKNYVFPAVGLRTKSYTVPPYRWVVFYSVYGDTDPTENSKIVQHRFSIPGSAAKIPGLSSYILEGNVPTSVVSLNGSLNFDLEGGVFDNLGTPIPLVYGQQDFTTGTDCSGFLARSANYQGNPYRLNSNGVAAHITTDLLGTEKYSTLIQGAVLDQKASAVLPNLRFAVPGDILNMGTGKNKHVVIVQNIRPDNLGTVTSRSQVDVIQSGVGRNFQWQVIPSLPWDIDSGMGSLQWWLYELRRLGTN